MKKKVLTTIFLTIMVLTVAGVAFTPHKAEASWYCLFLGPQACVVSHGGGLIIDSLAVSIGNLVLSVAAFFLTITGIILNISIILTMNIKAIYEATPAIDQVWLVIRNISSIFIIFGLLYASIATILDVGKVNVSTWVKNIIVAGLLINFSLFFTKVLIDTSNLVSLQFYRAIVPSSQNSTISKDGIGGILSSSFTSGTGIAEIFMTDLRINKIYDKTTIHRRNRIKNVLRHHCRFYLDDACSFQLPNSWASLHNKIDYSSIIDGFLTSIFCWNYLP